MLDNANSQLSQWLRGIFGESVYCESTMYATNVVKCSFRERPGKSDGGGFGLLEAHFEKCCSYLVEEVVTFQPTLLLTLGQAAHTLFVRLIDQPDSIAEPMKEAFTGTFYPVSICGVAFDYSPCLHISTFRNAETYGDKVRAFKQAATTYLAIHRAGAREG